MSYKTPFIWLLGKARQQWQKIDQRLPGARVEVMKDLCGVIQNVLDFNFGGEELSRCTAGKDSTLPSACQCRSFRRMGSIRGSGRYPGEGNGNSLQYSGWDNPRKEETGGLQSMGVAELNMTWRLNSSSNRLYIWYNLVSSPVWGTHVLAKTESSTGASGKVDTTYYGVASPRSLSANV